MSEEWISAVLDTLNASADVRDALKGVELTIQQVVTASGKQVRYWTRFDDGAVDANLGDAADPDVTITQDYETAVALNKGELKPQGAFMQGKLDIKGNMGKLLQEQAAVNAVAPVMASIDTEY